MTHSDSGPYAIDNYLPAHGLRNGYRWCYSPEEFQWMLKIGVWARGKMETTTTLGTSMLKHNYDRKRAGRRRAALTAGETLAL